MKEEYKDMGLDERINLAEELLLDYFKLIFRQYKWKKVTRQELKEELPYSKKPLEAICKSYNKTNLIGPSNTGYTQLRLILHEMAEIICNDKDLLDNKLLRSGEVRKFNHKRIDSIVKNVIEIYKGS